jgi:DNA-binding LacI/PurR family transcriptional regulator
LSTIAQPVARIAAQAGVMLRALMSGDEPDPEPRLFPATVVLRASA